MTAAGRKHVLRPVEEFSGVHDVWPRGARLASVRSAAEKFHERFAAGPRIEAVKTFEIAEAPYPSRFAFQGYSVHANPFITIVNRMMVIQFRGFDGELKTLVWEPTVPAGSAEAPFYHAIQSLGNKLKVERFFAEYVNDMDDVLPKLGLTNDDVDYVSFDHLHVQDVRRIMGSTEPLEGESAPRESVFPNAKLLAHRKELDTFASMHPMQWAWYVNKGMDGVPEDRLEVFDESIELGEGVALLWTPGHTDGNHSLAVNTPDGVFVQSENGMAPDNWHPEHSAIPGVKQQAEFYGREVVLNSNTLEDTQDQYDSMVMEKTVASRSQRDPRFSQVIPSSECSSKLRQWPLKPTFRHGTLDYGEITAHQG